MSKKVALGILLAVLVVITLILPDNIQPVRAEPSNIVATYGQGYLRDIDGLLVLNVKGSPYEMGYQHGFLLRDFLQEFIPYRIQGLVGQGYSYEYMVHCTQAMEPHIPQEYIQEIQGLADGAEMDYTDVLIWQMAPDITGYGVGWAGCSGFVVFGNTTMDAHLYHGRALDHGRYVPPGEPIGLIIVRQPGNGNAFVEVGLPGFVGVHAGMNEKCISLGWTGSRTSDATLDGMPSLLMFRKVLQDSNNLTEAIDIIWQIDRTVGWNILLGDGKDLTAAAVEISANHCKVFWAGELAEDVEPHYSIPNAVRRANHYVDPELAATQRSPYDPRVAGEPWEHSWDRYEKLSELIEENYGNIDAEMAIDFLRTPPVAWYPINAQSVVFHSTNLELWVANAAFNTPAYEREFIYLSYNDLFPDYTPEGDSPSPSPTGCFIATAAYGTPMAEEIQILREFRDGYLLTNPPGQAFVDFYYRVSPPIAEFITEHPVVKPIVRTALVPAVAMSGIVVNTSPAEKAAMVGLLVLVSVALAIWETRRLGRGREHS